MHFLRYVNISFILEFKSGTTIYCGRSLVAKIIIIVPFDMQSAYFRNFRSRHERQNIVWPKCVLFVDEIYNTQALFQRCGRTLMYILSIMGDPSISRSAQNTIKVD